MKRLKYFGHTARNKTSTLMTTVLQGKIEAKRRRGRPSTTYIENIKKISGMSFQKAIHQARSQDFSLGGAQDIPRGAHHFIIISSV